MCQEVDKEINFEDLRAKVNTAIKNRDISIIGKVEDDKQLNEHQLRYMQKYAESLISKKEIRMGYFGFGVAVFAIGLSLLSLSASTDVPHKLFSIEAIFVSIVGLVMMFWKKPPVVKKIEFIHEIILKIEEKLPSRT